MNTTAEIYLWGTRVGIIHQDLDKPYASFKYDLLEVGEKMGLKRKKCLDIISKISRVVSDFERYANEVNIREKTFSDIKEILNQNRVEV